MMDKWKLLAGRIDALSLRERALLFVSLLILTCPVFPSHSFLKDGRVGD